MKTVDVTFENCENAVFEAEVEVGKEGQVSLVVPETSDTPDCIEPNVYNKSLFERILSRRDIVSVSVDGTEHEVPWFDGAEYGCTGENLRQSGCIDDGKLYVSII